jgi:hypothetical protein
MDAGLGVVDIAIILSRVCLPLHLSFYSVSRRWIAIGKLSRKIPA